MEFVFGMLALCILLLIPGGFIIGLVALIRANSLVRQIRDLKSGSGDAVEQTVLIRRIHALEQTVQQLQGRVAAAPAAAPLPVADEAPPPEAWAEPAAEGPAAEEPAVELTEEVAVVAEPPEVPPTKPPAEIPAGPPPLDGIGEAALPPPVSPPPVSPPPVPPRPAPPARPAINWEQLIGIRFAARIGGAGMALAALMFFQISIQRGWISPLLRVVLGMLAGLACLFGSQWLHRRRQPYAANALAGAGTVILYGATWAAQHLYGLIGAAPAFILMLLITAACGTLALTRRSLLIAVLGLMGGFATPLLVAPGADHPLALFAYVLILDAGLLWLARRRQWPVLGILCLAGTALHQAVWIFSHMDAQRMLVGLAALAVFALAFLLLGPKQSEKTEAERPLWRWCRAGGVLLPFVFALHFAGTARLGEHLAPLAGLLLLLSLCACWQARRQPEPLLAPVAASATLGVVTLWFITHRFTVPLAWEVAGVCAGLTLAFAVMTWWGRRQDIDIQPSLEAGLIIIACGFLTLLVLASSTRHASQLWPWLAGWTTQAALLVWYARTSGRGMLQLVAGLAPAAGFLFFSASHFSRSSPQHHPSLFLAVVVVAAMVWQIIALAWSEAKLRRWGNNTAAATALALQLAILPVMHLATGQPALVLGAASALGLLAALAASRLGAGRWYLLATAATALIHTIFTFAHLDSLHTDALLTQALLLQGLSVVVFTAWPILTPATFATSRAAFAAAALAGPFWFLSLRSLYDARFGDATIGVLPIVLAVLSLTAAMRVRSFWARTDTARTAVLAWFLAVTLCLVSVAIPLQLEKEWITIGWALNGLAVLALWSRLDHPGLKYFGLALLAITTVRLVLNPAVLDYYPRGGLPVLNWLLYTYLVPAACLIGACAILARHERPRLRQRERRLFRERALAAPICGLSAVVVIFVWINLAITDYYGTTSDLVLSFERLPARDLTTSVAWAVYALALLAVGMLLDSTVLRWVSLGLFFITIGKVGLHDLSHLRDLKRVGSVAALAAVLLVVSVLYQLFVFRKGPAEETE